METEEKEEFLMPWIVVGQSGVHSFASYESNACLDASAKAVETGEPVIVARVVRRYHVRRTKKMIISSPKVRCREGTTFTDAVPEPLRGGTK